ncbi:MAG TPA: baseplate assembly protein [Candidatus Desulfovibrio intestinavium]|uniref:Baseplate assembly protein n=1 Tax=Candidatus Desulfovibrio intestinavium TaxID=2838534 RepID=A0A9D2HQA1_9BACT|nr:baseplate assembly protein [Candidatus Desulfovibrio intestinavium]
MADANPLDILRKAIELVMPDFRHYYRMTRKARVVNAYASDGKYYADVQPLRNDETDDPKEPLIPRVEIPILWGGPQRGIVCPPAPGTLCDLSYYDGDPNYPRISNFRWQGNVAPECGLNELVIQQTPGVSIRIEQDGSFLTVSPRDWTVEIGGNASIKAGGDTTVEAAGTLTLQAPNIHKIGNEICSGTGGGTGTTTENAHRTTNGSITVNGPLTVNGDLAVSGNSSVGGNSQAGSRSGGSCPH